MNNYSITPIIFRGNQYDSIKQAIERTDLSRYLIKKEAEYVDPNDATKFKNSGRSRVVPNTVPTKDEVVASYDGNIRRSAKRLGVTERVMNDLLDRYFIERMTLSESIIRRSDERSKPSKEKLIEKYRHSSIADLLSYYNVGHSKLMRWFDSYSISVRSLGETASIKHNTRHETIRPSYETLKDEYDRHNIYELSIQYGVDKHIVSDWLNDYGIDVSTNASRAENQLFEYCQTLDDSFIQSDRSLIAPFELDIVSHKHKLAIEYCGIYWHSETMGKTMNYHRNKYLKCRDLGYRLITVFETDDMEKIKALVRTHVQSNVRIFARNTRVCELESKTANQFHRDHHLSKTVGGSVHLGLYHENELVMVITFSRTRYNKNIEYECARMTGHSDYTVVGGASKLFKYFFTRYNVSSCITYADLRFGEGRVYENCGFDRQNDSNPNYFYFKGNELHLQSRVKYQKYKLGNMLDKYDSSLTENENMTMNGYNRIWDCGNAVYIYHNI